MKKISYILTLIITIAFASNSYAFIENNLEHFDVKVYTNYPKINEQKALDVLVEFDLKDKWHIYSNTPQEIAIPTTIQWQLPFGYEVSDVKWSDDEEFSFEGIKQYGYGDKAYYQAKIIPLKHSGLVDANLTADIAWLGCKDECVPGKTSISFSLPITDIDMLPSSEWTNAVNLANSPLESSESEESREPEESNLWAIILMAFVGGMALNLMPCIFPILSLKAISLVQSVKDGSNAKVESLLYMLGVVLSFLIMATILIVLRMQGEQIGWGFQLQSPVFVSIMIVIFFFVFLMLLDIVNIRNPFANKMNNMTNSKQNISSFLTGFFAVLIASPCTAPFMGVAIGYTLSQPAYIYYPIFLSLSIGYALPFTLVGFYPEFIKSILPKPGRWMEVLKKIFAIPVLLTCIWLSWVLYNQTIAPKVTQSSNIDWQTYDSEKAQTLIAEGKPVLINFTAKWCITCLVNDKLVLSTDKFEAIVKEKDITIFKADWTNKDETITRELEKYGRNSVPLYVYYNGKNNDYVILPQILTKSDLDKFLK